ncbi:hypothetical protein Tco_0507078, partial [Tanacetum coccineum]
CHELRRSVSIRCQGYIGDFVLGSHAVGSLDHSMYEAQDQ